MDLVFYNIQGFRGQYKYSIDDTLTIINSKFNGVGKTTLYDCLRFVIDSSHLDKDEHKFFLNMNEKNGLFTARKGDVAYGFILQENKPIVFFRKVDGEEIEKSGTNFPTAGSDLGLFVVNGTILNLFSKEVNLFSTSSGSADYKLVKVLTTHEETEDMLESIRNSLEFAVYDKVRLNDEVDNYKFKLSNTPYYPNLKLYEEMLENNFYTDMDVFLDNIDESLKFIKPVYNLEINSNIMSCFLEISDSINRLEVSEADELSSDLLVWVEDTSYFLNKLTEVEEEDVSYDILNTMSSINGSLENIKEQGAEIFFNTDILKIMELLDDGFDRLKVCEKLEVKSNILNMITSTTILIAGMSTNTLKIEQLEKSLSRERSSISDCRVVCPIREEVYLIDGKCVY